MVKLRNVQMVKFWGLEGGGIKETKWLSNGREHDG